MGIIFKVIFNCLSSEFTHKENQEYAVNKFIAALYYLKCQNEATDPCFCISLLSTYSSRKIKINYALTILTPLNCYPLIEAIIPDIIHVLWNPDAEVSSVPTLPWISRGRAGAEAAEEPRGFQRLQLSHLVTVTVTVCDLEQHEHSPGTSQLGT